MPAGIDAEEGISPGPVGAGVGAGVIRGVRGGIRSKSGCCSSGGFFFVKGLSKLILFGLGPRGSIRSSFLLTL